MPTIKIHNAETGEVVEREMNDEELTKLDRVQEESEARAKAQTEAAAKKAAAEAKLAALGLDADDLKALGLA
jgi:hypothetical protein